MHSTWRSSAFLHVLVLLSFVHANNIAPSSSSILTTTTISNYPSDSIHAAQHPRPDGEEISSWLDVRKNLVSVLFGRPDGTLPNRTIPDYIESIASPSIQGCFCAYQGYCNASQCQYDNNMTKIVWTTEAVVNSTYTLRLNSTVFHTINTTGVAPGVADGSNLMGSWSFPSPPQYQQRLGDTLVIFHHGHSQPCDQCPTPWLDSSSDYLNQLGFDSMVIQMPLHMCNYINGTNCDHQWFEQFREQGVSTMRFFLEPVVLTINYAMEVLGYKRVVMMGLSGGGWTTTMMAAIDPRIGLSIPIAGSIPCDFNHTSWDYEQYCTNDWCHTCNYTCLYVLAALEPNRTSVQVLHEQDPCCFAARGVHEPIEQYNNMVRTHTTGQFQTVATVGNVHEFNERDQTIASLLLDVFRRRGYVPPSYFQSLPYNVLQQW
eukprot:TRINITY_DN17368_c0_g1_i1.p1 TRINITY_DN17368_c0_g1~~TRINITY_DN17368_c0_g1_i1.p1  ORF type:complete len:476 (-),score=31.85 TRINITY_DN17368_c0_g1_i1:258-1547(-)